MTSASKGQFLAWFINLIVIFYRFSCEIYNICEAMKKKSILITACYLVLVSSTSGNLYMHMLWHV